MPQSARAGTSPTAAEPLLSVVVLAYNHAPYVRQALDSVLAQQTSFPFEVCIGEDESSDGTREICREYADQYPAVIRLFLRNRKDVVYIDGRPSGRYNFLETLRACRGRYIALLDADDYWTEPTKLQQQVEVLEREPGLALVAHQTAVQTAKGTSIRGARALRKHPGGRVFTLADYLLGGCFFHTSSIVARNTLTFPLPGFVWTCGSGDQLIVALLVGRASLLVQDRVWSVSRKLGSGMTSVARNLSLGRFLARRARILWAINRHYTFRYTPHVIARLTTLLARDVVRRAGRTIGDIRRRQRRAS
jgi:glycosyltransferase involved in cell wall biosynthesis